MKIWGNEFHLMFVTDATAVYYGDYGDDIITIFGGMGISMV